MWSNFSELYFEMFTRSDPPKRRIHRVSPAKRRSSSHSPKSAKGGRRNAGSSTDSDAEKGVKSRRRKYVVKIGRKGSSSEEAPQG